jgi:hypothetical protein
MQVCLGAPLPVCRQWGASDTKDSSGFLWSPSPRYKLYPRNALFALDNTVALQESWQRYSETEKELATWLMCGNLDAIFDLFAETTATTSHSETDIADLSVSFIEHRRRASLVAGYVAQHGV